MMRNKIAFILAMLMASAACLADVDRQCLNDCTQSGRQRAICVAKCSSDSGVAGQADSSAPTLESFMQGYKAASEGKEPDAEGTEAQIQSQMTRELDAACKKENQQACSDLKKMLLGK
ncbi:MAG: hypothetical protein WC073_01685 [Sterolibacterium sp.]